MGCKISNKTNYQIINKLKRLDSVGEGVSFFGQYFSLSLRLVSHSNSVLDSVLPPLIHSVTTYFYCMCVCLRVCVYIFSMYMCPYVCVRLSPVETPTHKFFFIHVYVSTMPCSQGNGYPQRGPFP